MRFGEFDVEHKIFLEGGSFSSKKDLCLCRLISKFKRNGMRRTAEATDVGSHLKIHFEF